MQYQDKWKMKISLDIYNLTKEIQSLQGCHSSIFTW